MQRRLRSRESLRRKQFRREQPSRGSGANRVASKLELRSNKNARKKPSEISPTAHSGDLTSHITVLYIFKAPSPFCSLLFVALRRMINKQRLSRESGLDRMQDSHDVRSFATQWTNPTVLGPFLCVLVGAIFAMIGLAALVSSFPFDFTGEGGIFGFLLFISSFGLIALTGIGLFGIGIYRLHKMLTYSICVAKDGITIRHGRRRKSIGIDQLHGIRHRRHYNEAYSYTMDLVHDEGEDAVDVEALCMDFEDIEAFDALVNRHLNASQSVPAEKQTPSASEPRVSPEPGMLRSYVASIKKQDAFYGDRVDQFVQEGEHKLADNTLSPIKVGLICLAVGFVAVGIGLSTLLGFLTVETTPRAQPAGAAIGTIVIGALFAAIGVAVLWSGGVRPNTESLRRTRRRTE